MMILQKRRKRYGFTFLEIMFVVVIIGILLALVGPRLLGKSEKARETATQAQIQQLSQSIVTFNLDLGTLPKTLDELVEDTGNKMWDGPYLAGDSLPQDAWGNDFFYALEEKGRDNRRASFKIWSAGPDGADDGGDEDDITSWKKEDE